jgi:hypothetical protein
MGMQSKSNNNRGKYVRISKLHDLPCPSLLVLIFALIKTSGIKADMMKKRSKLALYSISSILILCLGSLAATMASSTSSPCRSA